MWPASMPESASLQWAFPRTEKRCWRGSRTANVYAANVHAGVNREMASCREKVPMTEILLALKLHAIVADDDEMLSPQSQYAQLSPQVEALKTLSGWL